MAVEAVLIPAMTSGIGYYIDQKQDWFPWASLIGFGVGIAIGAKVLVTAIRIQEKSNGSDEDQKKENETK